MPEALFCTSCGSPLTGGEPKGLCARCLIKRGLESNTVGYTENGETAKGWEPPTPAELAGQFVDVEVMELLGRGGMGAVYMARQKQLDRVVALKILPPGVGQDPAFSARFTQEAKALARLNHPNIVTLYEFGRIGAGLYYFLMEYVDGVSLRRLMEGGRVALREALAIVPQVCDALQYAHDQGIVHRDIKPENVLLDRRGKVKVADFGLAKMMGQDESFAAEKAGGLFGAAITETGRVVGTPQYMAPEQVGDPGEVDHRADIYALGVVFYQMLTGELPAKPVVASRSRKIHLDVRLDEVVLRALEREPRLRYAQASEMKTQMETIAGTPPAGERILAERGKTGRTALAVICALMFVGILATCVLIGEWRRDEAAVMQQVRRDHDAAESERHSLALQDDALEQQKLNYDARIHAKADRMNAIATRLASAGVGIAGGSNSKEFELQSLISEQVRAMTFLGAAYAKVKAFETQLETKNVSEPKGDLERRRAELISDRVAADQARVRIDKRVQDVREEISDLAKERNEYDRLAADVVRLSDHLERVKERQDDLRARRSVNSTDSAKSPATN